MRLSPINSRPSFGAIRNIEVKQQQDRLAKPVNEVRSMTAPMMYLAEAMKKSPAIKKLQQSEDVYDIKITSLNGDNDNPRIWQYSRAKFEATPVNSGAKKEVYASVYNYNGCTYEAGLTALASYIEKCEEFSDEPKSISNDFEREIWQNKNKLLGEVFNEKLDSLKNAKE